MSDYGVTEERKPRTNWKTRKIIRDPQRQRGEEAKGKALHEVVSRFEPRPPQSPPLNRFEPRPPQSPPHSTRVEELEHELKHLALVQLT